MFLTPADSATVCARGIIWALRSMPVTWPFGMRLAKLMEMVPEPAPTSRSFRCGLESFLDCSFGRRKAALFSAVRCSWRVT